jgi:Flp pilus assembly protein TadG
MEQTHAANVSAIGHRSGRWSDERGAELLEFALIGPIFLMMLLGLFQGGLVVWQHNMVSRLAQEGARWASVRGSGSATPATGAQVQAYVQNRAPGMNVTVTTTSVNPATKACTATAVNPSSLSRGDGVCVRVTSPFSAFMRIVPIGSKTLQTTAQMRVAR